MAHHAAEHRHRQAGGDDHRQQAAEQRRADDVEQRHRGGAGPSGGNLGGGRGAAARAGAGGPGAHCRGARRRASKSLACRPCPARRHRRSSPPFRRPPRSPPSTWARTAFGSRSASCATAATAASTTSRRPCASAPGSTPTACSPRRRSQRGLACLARFARRLAGFAPPQVRAVATQTLREARNRDAFLARGAQALGHPIEVISGREEARLIYLGVARLQPSDRPRLVIDIGGRSTELILGRGRKPARAESFPVGSVSLSMRYFADGRFTESAFRAAQVAAGRSSAKRCRPFARAPLAGGAGLVGHRRRGVAGARRRRRHRRPHHPRGAALVHRALPRGRPRRSARPARPEGRPPRR